MFFQDTEQHSEYDHPISGEYTYSGLPDTLACLLGSAIADARSLDRKRYYPNFEQWHEPTPHLFNPVCQVCLAGSLIAGTLEIPTDSSVSPPTFDINTYTLLHALDDMRTGDWIAAFKRVYPGCPVEDFQQKLVAIPEPRRTEFTGWLEFEQHLASLEKIIPLLKDIDKQVLERQSRMTAAALSG